ncbi:hypothetical protein GCM10017620_25880 [Brevundimonas intermedia]|uniref:Phage virion morphogenesis protein n=1 Tax=Brevundimonas intermedia TaxID=74315 RepID=A0ABQ5T9X5_9CAUL|nr:phage virion morphogenesis protein [Brevundimonas intermedia]GLK49615.1 hypothetical protein GCM10017620_25880 [Brevundimonas intermedia]
MDDIQQLHQIATQMLEKLEPGQRRRMLFRMSMEMRRPNQRRMTRQVAPDGSLWEKRKPRPKAKPATRPAKFLYPSGGVGEPRVVDMRSWIGRGDYLVGFDREAEGLRTFERAKIIKWITPEGVAGSDGEATARRAPRAKQMFRGLRSGRHLRAGADADGGWIEFTQRASRIALIHQEGRRDRVSPDGPEIDYPQRELIGFGREDEARLLNLFIDEAGDALGWGRRAGV